MPQQVRKRKQITVDFSANNVISQPLSRGMVYRELYLRLQGAATTTIANNTRANTLRGDEWGVVRKIEIIANGTDVLKSISGDDLWWLNYFMFRVPPQITPIIGDAATANPSFDSVLVLPFWMPGIRRPIDTALDARVLSSLEIAVTWGTFTHINSAATAFTTNPTLEVYSAESYNLAANAAFSTWRNFLIEKEITASNAQFQVDLPLGHMYRGFLINTTDGDVDQGDILNTFKIISGSTVFADVHAQDDVLQQVERLRSGIVRTYDEVDNAYDDLRRSNQSAIAGWYLYDHVMDGFLTEAIDTLGFSEFKLECDVTVGAGTTKLRVIPMQVVPVRSNAAAAAA